MSLVSTAVVNSSPSSGLLAVSQRSVTAARIKTT